MIRTPVIAGNWKMNGGADSIGLLTEGLSQVQPSAHHIEWVVFPPFPYLTMVHRQLGATNVGLGGQTVSAHAQGAFTGAVSVSMLKDCGCQYVLVGHSERRTVFGETNEQVAAQFKAALDGGLQPILCVGETLAQRESGVTHEIIKEQLAVVLALQDNASTLADAMIAYEPVWAIGTGRVATGEQAQDVHLAIRQQLAEFDPGLAHQMRILYGGSVKPSNAAELFSMPDIDGALVGGASLDAKQFISIGESWNK